MMNKMMSAQDAAVGAAAEQTPEVDKLNIAEAEAAVNPADRLSLQTETLNDVMDSFYEPREPIIDNLLYPGTYILAGVSKIGKSFLVAEIAFHVAEGRDLWNEKYRTKQGEVLYLALEDDLQRIQTRYSKMFGTEGSSHLHFATASKTVDEGFLYQLTEYLIVRPQTSLIIIDTLQKIRGLSNETISYSKDYDVITQMKNLSDKNNLCILIVHHTRKQDSEDCFEKISGTNGLMGSADAAIIMTRRRGSSEGKLTITGRDQQEQIIHIEQDPKTLVWGYKESETTLWQEEDDPLLLKISEMLLLEKEWSGTATGLIEKLRLDGIAVNALSRKLNSKASDLCSRYSIRYSPSRRSDSRILTFKLMEK